MKVSDEARRGAHVLIAHRLGLDALPGGEAAFDRALVNVAKAARAPSVDACIRWLDGQPADGPAWARLTPLLTVGETYFFRDGPALTALELHILPALVGARRSRAPLRLRLWSAGCATGEEPYTLAILLDRLLPDRARWDITIVGSDLNPAAVEAARRGLYREWSLREVPAAVRARYFERHGKDRFELDPEIRRMVVFEQANLTKDLPLTVADAPMDLILCRNALMYLTPDALCQAVGRLQAALAHSGWLLVAPAEASAERFRPLVTVNFPGTIFFRKGRPRAPEALRAPARPEHVFMPLPPPRPPPPAGPPALPPSASPAPTPLVERARALADRGDLHEALRLCEAGLETDRLDAELHGLIAAIHQELGEPVEALIALRRALYLDADNPALHLALGNLLMQSGHRRRAQRHLEAAQRLAARAEAS